MLSNVKRDYRLQQYSLDYVAKNFLWETKGNVHFSQIQNLQAGDEFSRRKLAIYCLKDAYLSLKLLEKLSFD